MSWNSKEVRWYSPECVQIVYTLNFIRRLPDICKWANNGKIGKKKRSRYEQAGRWRLAEGLRWMMTILACYRWYWCGSESGRWREHLAAGWQDCDRKQRPWHESRRSVYARPLSFVYRQPGQTHRSVATNNNYNNNNYYYYYYSHHRHRRCRRHHHHHHHFQDHLGIAGPGFFLQVGCPSCHPPTVSKHRRDASNDDCVSLTKPWYWYCFRCCWSYRLLNKIRHPTSILKGSTSWSAVLAQTLLAVISRHAFRSWSRRFSSLPTTLLDCFR